MRVLVFGDSITQGFWDLEYGGWVQRLRKVYDTRTLKNRTGDWPGFFNLGVSDDTTGGAVKRMSYEIEARRQPDDQFTLVFAIGINDTVIQSGEALSTPEQYRDELDVLISGARHYSERLLFVGLTPVDDKLCNPYVHNPTLCFSNNRILQFEEVLRKMCIEKEIRCVQVFEKFQEEQQRRELLTDGLHPNDAGHQLLADLIKPELDKLL